MSDRLLSTKNISNVFSKSLQERSGMVADTFDDGARLFSRSLLPFVEHVRPGDRLQGGLALRATDRELSLHPYVFREVCSNGAIMAHSVQSWHAEYSDYESESDVMISFWEALGTCSEEEVFAESVRGIGNSLHFRVNSPMSLALMISHQGFFPQMALDMIFQRFSSSGDGSRFSLMNAITSVARDTSDQELRWRLEELGGGIGAGISPEEPQLDGGLHKPIYE